MNIVLLMMGGSGTRFGADIPKQYTLINNQPIFSYILKEYLKMEEIDKIIIVTNSAWNDYVKEWRDKLSDCKRTLVTNGGASRSESVLNGLKTASVFAGENDVILIHDATHPYVDKKGTREIITAVNTVGGATLGACQYDTCYLMDADQKLTQVIPRQFLVSGASPEAFRFGDIYRIYTEASHDELEAMTSAGAIALANGIEMKVIPANMLNLKITYPSDMELFKCLCNSYFFEERGE